MIDILLGSPHMDIRLSVVDQLYQLCQTINTGGKGDKEGEGGRGTGEGREWGEGVGGGGWDDKEGEGRGGEDGGRERVEGERVEGERVEGGTGWQERIEGGYERKCDMKRWRTEKGGRERWR